MKKGLFLLAVLLLAACGKRAEYNTVVISVDTLRRDYVGHYNPDRASLTPRVDRLMGESATFDDAFTPVPITLPAFTSLFSGLYPHRHGIHYNLGFTVGPDLPLMAPLFAEAGRHTIGVIGGKPLSQGRGLERGFAFYDDRFLYRPATGNPLFTDTTAGPHLVQRPAMDVTYAAIEALEARPADRPFFLFLHYWDPHTPYIAPAEYAARFPDDPYAAEVAATDAAVGALLDHLRKRNLYDPSVIVFLSDHGEGLGEHGEKEHGYYLYGTTVSVPLGIKLPAGMKKAPPPRRVGGLVSLLDLFPTLCALNGIEAPAGLDGVDLSPVLLEGKAPARDRLFLETHFGYFNFGWEKLYGMLRLPSKAVFSAAEPALYDLAKDPREEANLHPGGEYDALQREARPYLKAAAEERARLEVSMEDIKNLGSLGYLSPARPSEGTAALPPSRWPPVIDAYLATDQAIKARDYAGAFAAADGALKRFPGEYRMLLNRGYALLLLKRFPEALADTRAALALNPDYVEGWAHLLQIYNRLGDTAGYDGAMAEALKRFPEFPFLSFIVDRLVQAGRVDEALEKLRETMRRYPDFTYGYLKYLEVAGASRPPEEVRAFLDGVVKDPRTHRAMAAFFRGMDQLGAGQGPAALAAFRESCAQGADFYQPYFQAGMLFKGGGDGANAAAYLNAANLLFRDNPQILYEYADSLALAGRFEDSLRAFTEMTALEPANPKVHLALYKLAFVMKRDPLLRREKEWLARNAPQFLESARQNDPLVRQIPR